MCWSRVLPGPAPSPDRGAAGATISGSPADAGDIAVAQLYPQTALLALPLADAQQAQSPVRICPTAPRHQSKVSATEECGAEGVVDLMVLEQFVTLLPERMAEWVQYCRQMLLDEAVQLAEDHLVAYLGAGKTFILLLSLLSLSCSHASHLSPHPNPVTAPWNRWPFSSNPVSWTIPLPLPLYLSLLSLRLVIPGPLVWE